MRVALLLLLVAACKSAPAPAPAPPPSPAPPPTTSEGAFDDVAWRAEAEQVLFERHMKTARLYRDALDLDKALDQVNQALLLKPTSDEARALRIDLQKQLGMRAGEVQTMLDDEWLALQAKEEQRQVEARRLIKEAREAEEAGDFDRAAEAYRRAIYLTRGSAR